MGHNWMECEQTRKLWRKDSLRSLLEGGMVWKENIDYLTEGNHERLFFWSARVGAYSVILWLNRQIELGQSSPLFSVCDADGNTPLMVAAGEGHLSIVKFLVKKNFDISKKSKSGFQALHFAVEFDSPIVVSFLLKKGANCNAVADVVMFQDKSPLFLAVDAHNKSIVEQLIKCGVDTQFCAPITLAIKHGFFDILMLLLSSTNMPISNLALKIAVDIGDEVLMGNILEYRYETRDRILGAAVRTSNIKSYKSLLNRQDIRVKYGENKNALALACACGNIEIIELLLGSKRLDDVSYELNPTSQFIFEYRTERDLKMKLISKYETLSGIRYTEDSASFLLQPKHLPFAAAVMNDRDYVLKMLAKSDRSFMTDEFALAVACSKNNYDYVRILLGVKESLLNVNSTKFKGKSALMYAVEGSQMDLIELLLNHGRIDTNIGNIDGFFPLLQAVLGDDIKTVKLLINHKKTDLNAIDKHRGTALFLALKNDRFEIFSLLLSCEAINPNLGDERNTPLTLAIETTQLSYIELLLEDERIHVNSMTYDGKSMLFRAVESKDIDIVALLINHPLLNVNKGFYGSTGESIQIKSPLMLGVEIGDLKIVQLLLSHKGIRPNQCGTGEKTPLIAGIETKNFHIVSALLSHEHIDPNVNGALWQGFRHYEKSIIELLTRHPRIKYDIYDNGQAPLISAIKESLIEMLRFLIEDKDTEVNIVDLTNDAHDTPLSLVVKSNSPKRQEMLKLLSSRVQDILPSKYLESIPPLVALLFTPKSDETTFMIKNILTNERFDVNSTVKCSQYLNNIALKGKTALHIAVEVGELWLVKLLLESNSLLPNKKNAAGCSPLYEAVIQKKDKIIKQLINDSRIDLNTISDSTNKSVFMESILNNRIDLFKDFLPGYKIGEELHDNNKIDDIREVDINQFVKNNCALRMAIENNNQHELKCLLHQETLTLYPELQGERYDPLHHAVCNESLHLVKTLLGEKSIDPNLITLGTTPVMYAVEIDNVDMLRILIQHPGVDVNIEYKKKSAISIAILRGKEAIINLFVKYREEDIRLALKKAGPKNLCAVIDSGAVQSLQFILKNGEIDLNKGTNYLIKAVESKRLKILSILLDELTLDVNRIENDTTAFRIALSSPKLGKKEKRILSKLLTRKDLDPDLPLSTKHPTLLLEKMKDKDINAVNYLLGTGRVDTNAIYKNASVLMKALEWGDKDIVEKLLKNSEIEVTRIVGGTTALHYSINSRKLHFTTQILQHPKCNADVVVHSSVNTVLQEAVIKKDIKLIKLLIKYGNSNFNKPSTSTNRSILIEAIYQRNEVIVGLLLKKEGIDVNRKFGEETALDIATRIQEFKLVSLLLEKPEVSFQEVHQKTVESILISWVRKKNTKGLKSLLQKRMFDPNTGNALMYAIEGGDARIVEMFLSNKNIDVNKRLAESRDFPLFYSARLSLSSENFVIFEKLLNHQGMDVDALLPETEISLLFYCVRKKYIQLVRKILNRKKANVNFFDDKSNRSILLEAIHVDSVEIVKEILKTDDIKANKIISNMTPLMYAIEHDKQAIFDCLLKNKKVKKEFSLSVGNEENYSALTLANEHPNSYYKVSLKKKLAKTTLLSQMSSFIPKLN